jgi:leucyl aminopeptidase
VQLDLSPVAAARAAFGLTLRAWRPPPELRLPLPDDEAPTLREAVLVAHDSGWPPLAALADSICAARDLAVLPANLLTPETFEQRARALTELGCTVEVLDAAALRRQGLNLLAAVGQGSAQPPRLVVVRWAGADGPPLALVGKGITFDSGGLSIKHGDSMAEMKGDMAGAAAALMALRCLAATKAPVHAVAVLAIAENMPSERSLRPGDVIRGYSGRTVEVVDTDAEGRLVLADALAWSCARLKPRAVVDLATLTGAVITTLGRHHAGLFANDDPLAAALLAAGRACGEKLWRLPLSEAHDEALKSDVADVKNCAWGFVPDALHAARFLQGFVPADTPWAHLDIAGTAWAKKDSSTVPKGATAFGVRLLDRLVADHYES